MSKNDKKIKNCVVFFDFDNTITEIDVLDDMLERFSRDDKWMQLEEEWRLGKIGSRECLDGQMRGIRLARERLDKYLTTIKIDPFFKKILKLCGSKKIKTVILSDNFEYILKGILKNNDIEGLDVYCNSLKMLEDVMIPSFPHSDKKCGGCAHCKSKNMLANVKAGFTSIYIGDGLSDLCPSRKAKLVFAKSSLKEHLKAEKVPHVPFDDMKDVYEYLKRRLA
ncbi:MAG: MtnX-like HAD-IB family phosphatase [Candidatus Omnitrophica bacterium]|nr:MtnX-like HAD-IB family phosphatase [Candidatus Omnitrophota bacterium]